MVETYTGPRNPTDTQPVSDPFFGGYTELIDLLFQANGQVALAIDDPTLRRGVELTDLASHQIENVARLIRVLLLAGVAGGLTEPGRRARPPGSSARSRPARPVRQLGIGRYQPAAAKVDEDFSGSGFIELAGWPSRPARCRSPTRSRRCPASPTRAGTGSARRSTSELETAADELNEEAATTPAAVLRPGGLALVVAVLVTWLVSRSITRPLRSLTRQAKEMAERPLPDAVTDILETPLGDDVTVPTVDPVRVNTRDEVSDVADALNTVQDSALDLAVEQAVLRRNIADSFVNLGRRNQNLLGRQLDFITELETNETDADTLANLFRLDHLATRMRRNAESLLVLAGIEPPRQWAAPVRLTDVIRAALGEVEDYQRVTVRGVEPATIIGSAAADLAHLLAELIENALVFSPPDQTVDIRGRNRPGGPVTTRPATRSPSSTRASACRPATSRPPTGAWRAPRASPSRRPSTWATTWPATSPPATTSGSRSTTRPATASRPRSTCRRRCSRATASWPPSPPRRGARPSASTPRSHRCRRCRSGSAGRRRPTFPPPPRSTPPPRRPGAVRCPARGHRIPTGGRAGAAHPHGQRPGQAARVAASPAPAASMPDADLLANLSSIADNLPGWRRRSRRHRNARRPGGTARRPGHQPVDAAGPGRAPDDDPLVAGTAARSRPRLPPAPAAPAPDPRRERPVRWSRTRRTAARVTPPAGPRRAAWPAVAGRASCPRRSR